MTGVPSVQKAEEAVDTLLRYIESIDSDSSLREGLARTPERVIQSWSEIFSGYSSNAADVLDSTFNAEGYDGIVLLKEIEFHSTCEHHLQPFSGSAHVAYIPVGQIVGVSKLARLVDMYARRLQNQERITQSVADALVDHLHPLGCAVILEASHGCMRCRGVAKQNAVMTTSAMRGVFFEKSEARAELLQLVNGG
ncbi:MAG: GTP cyclohydrolase I FolE [Euryarchaeota archaeon]|nr:GTP cyclohydrolase I FolE [Euryarchaeota archaeon]